MGLKSQFQMKMKQKMKRRKGRKRLIAKNLDPKEYYYGKYYIKLGSNE